VEENDISHDLDEVDFPTKFRGYDPFEVDGMLERARREILDLRSRARTADDRARSAEEQLDVELTAARQAHGEANAVLATAKEEAERVVANARVEAERLVTASETEIREAIESGRNQLLGELAELESRRDKTRSSIELAELQMAAHRDRLLSAIEDLRSLIGGLTVVSLPTTLEMPAGPDSKPSTFGGDDPGESSTTGVGPVGVVHHIEPLLPVVETGNSGDPGDTIAELPRLTEETGDDTVVFETFFSEEGGDRSGTGGP
tara:strand:+ start:642 stop:1424 length:783 start_codon:yes stop_codon:yes gene_type:complete